MSMTPGTLLGPYEILAPIGEGGMGDVYKARDTRLNRIVALKTSKTEFSERFEREARAVAALNHSNICTLHDVGPNYLVMEYIEGAPLKGPLPLDQALKYAAQICDALDAAHKKGITHRDLKPANILVTKTGIKLLDFGIAKMSQSTVTGSEDATVRMALTGNNEMVGTLYYMSPEQLQGQGNGQPVDSRSDIFSFGVVLYEMLTGKRAFAGSSPATVIAAIMERPAPSIADVAPPALDHVLKKCLAKDPDQRWQTARDLKGELEWIASASPDATAAPAASRHRLLPWLVAAALLMAVLLLIPWRGQPAAVAELVRFPVYPPPGTAFTGTISTSVPVPQFALSPDGRTLVFAAAPDGVKPTLWLRSFDEVAARLLPGTEDAARPFWSPDGRSIGFVAEGKLKRIPSLGGPVQVFAENVGVPRGASWAASGMVYFGQANNPINSVKASGGPIIAVTKLDESNQEGMHIWPHLLPGGNHFLFTIRSGKGGYSGVYAKSFDASPGKLLVGQDSSGVYASPGYLLWVDGDTLVGQMFDADRLELHSQPFNVAKGVGRSSSSEAAVSVASSATTLAYSSSILRLGRLTWFDRSGNSLDSPTPDGDYVDFRLSPDDKRLAVSLVDSKTSHSHLWLYDLIRGGASRFTPGLGLSAAPVWAPDGSRLVFRTFRNGVIELYQKSTSMGGNEEPLLTVADQQATGTPSSNTIPTSWSPDGKYLIYSIVVAGAGFDLGLLPNPGASPHNPKPVQFLGSASDEIQASFSPDGRFVAYASNETGRYQVYVQTFPLSDRKWPVSTHGGYEPQWRGDGREIYYLSEDRKLMVVQVGAGPSFGVPKPLFQTRVPGGVEPLRMHYVPTRDGQRFLVNTQIGDPTPNPITVVLNWTAGLKK